eukprot:s1432_g8.t1
MSDLVTLYDVRRTGQQVEGAWILSLDFGLPPLPHRPSALSDLGFVHDACCGLGGFSTAFDFFHTACDLPGKVVSACDLCSLTMSAYQLNHSSTAWQGDVTLSETVYKMHMLQFEEGVQALLASGFPCQPLSRQGSQQRQNDLRSRVLPALLRAAFWLQSSGLCLECVPEALTDPGTQHALREFAALMHYTLIQQIVHLHHTWPSKRSRWFGVLVPAHWAFKFEDLPQLSPAPVVGNVIPFTNWPVWHEQDEAQLRWTEMEVQTYHNPEYGSTDRKVDLNQPLATALHSWGSALYACPCKCRLQGFHPTTLKSRGLRGVEVVTSTWPHVSRHIHPRELQLLLGFPPLQLVLSDCRAQLCLFGNSVSPIQVLWVLSHMYVQHDMLRPELHARAVICQYMQAILLHRDITWPSPIPGVARATLDFPDTTVQVVFNTTETIGNLIRAEATLQLDTHRVIVSAEGLELPDWAFVQERTYQVQIQDSHMDFSVVPVPILLDFLGVRKIYVVPASFTVENFVACAGIENYQALVDEHHQSIPVQGFVQPWQVVVVQLSPADVEFELSLRLEGFGFLTSSIPHGLHVSETWGGTGLWHVDQLVKSNLLVSWAGNGFGTLTVWLPSFAAAVVELWPSTVEDSLQAWLRTENTCVYAIVWEARGWNLVKITTTATTITTAFFEPDSQVSCTAAHVAYRAYRASGRAAWTETTLLRGEEFGPLGTLQRIFALLDFDFGLPADITALLWTTRHLDLVDFRAGVDHVVSPTLPYECQDQQLPLPLTSSTRSAFGIGLTAKFLLTFARAWTQSRPFDFQEDQVKVVSLGSAGELSSVCKIRVLQAAPSPLHLFVLVGNHWIFLTCSLQGDTLSVKVYDGLACTDANQLRPLLDFLRGEWQAAHVQVQTLWEVPQTRVDSCGTIALAHFGLQVGLLTHDQAMHFELFHESFAICGSLAGFQGPVGWGMAASVLPRPPVRHQTRKDVFGLLDFLRSSLDFPSSLHPSSIGFSDLCSLPESLGVSPAMVLKPGLTANFLLDFAMRLGSLSPSDSCLVSIVVLGRQSNEVPMYYPSPLYHVKEPQWIFVLVDFHWTLLRCSLAHSNLTITHYDGLFPFPSHALAQWLQVQQQHDWISQVTMESASFFPQTRPDSCGTVALAHFAFSAGICTHAQAGLFEAFHDLMSLCNSRVQFLGPFGLGVDEEAIIQSLEQILPAKGVPPEEVRSRANAAIKVFGCKALQQALQTSNAWVSLKSLGNSKPKPFVWVKHHELQQHIQDRAQSKFGAVDQKKPTKKPGRKESVLSKYLDPASLLLPPDLFITNCGSVLPQLQLEEVQKDARGVAFASPEAVQHFLADGKMTSQEGLALLVVGQLPESTSLTLPMHTLRVPAIYKGTNEPVILDCTSIQLGDQAVYRRTNQAAPDLVVCPTRVLRAHVFKDLWQQEQDWSAFLAHPVRSLVQAFPLFRLCKDIDCDRQCPLFHPSLEEDGVESGLLDVWAFRWHGLDGSKQPHEKAEVLSVYLRVPESSFDQLHRASGTFGVFFEPRSANSPGPDEAFAVIWVPQIGLSDALHRVRTLDHSIAVCRLGLKYGIRCLVKHQEDLHQALCPSKPFVHCAVKAVYRLEPLPAGTQRSSLVDTLKQFGWNAKPLQPCKGSQGQAWQVGAETEPPKPFIESQQGWIGISKVKDAAPVAKPQGMIATTRTKKHIQESSAHASASTSDPWHHGASASTSDPWGGYTRTTKAPVVPSQHVQSRMEDVETRLQAHVRQTLTQEVQQLPQHPETDLRLTAVENQIQSLVENQTRIEHWVQDGSSKVHQLQQDCAHLHSAVQTQGNTLQQVAVEVQHCTGSLKTMATEASKYQQCAMQSYLRSLSRRSGRHLRSTLGAPASLRPGSTHAGTWTGVLSFGDCAMQQIPCAWPSGEFESGRVLLSAAHVSGLEIVSATVYLPPKGPTYPKAAELSEALLTPITENLVLGRSGCRAILGDMNCPSGSLCQMRVWQSCGWVELQELMFQLHGIPKRATCKNATSPDQIWLSPELASLVQNMALWDIFPDHQVLIAGIRLPQTRVTEPQWRLPGHIPWQHVNLDLWNASSSWGELFDSYPSHEVGVGLVSVPNVENSRSSCSATSAFRRWSAGFERRVTECLPATAVKADKSFYGRGTLTRPRFRRVNAPLIKNSRPGEVAPASGFLNRSVASWY